MTTPVAARLLGVCRWLAIVLLAVGVVGYPVALQIDAWVFGILLLGVGPVQIGTALLGGVARTVWRDRQHARIDWIVGVLLLGTAVAAYAFVRTISWT